MQEENSIDEIESERLNEKRTITSLNMCLLDLAQRSVWLNNIEIWLTNMEFEILYLLASNPGRVFTIEQIYNIIWNNAYLGDCATVTGHISSIRQKIGGNPHRQLYIQTVRGK